MITLMLTTLGCICSGAAEQQHVTDAVLTLLASLKASDGEGDGEATPPVPAAPACARPCVPDSMNEGEDAVPDLATESDDEDYEASCPRLPCAATLPGGHREKCTRQGLYNACVSTVLG